MHHLRREGGSRQRGWQAGGGQPPAGTGRGCRTCGQPHGRPGHGRGRALPTCLPNHRPYTQWQPCSAGIPLGCAHLTLRTSGLCSRCPRCCTAACLAAGAIPARGNTCTSPLAPPAALPGGAYSVMAARLPSGWHAQERASSRAGASAAATAATCASVAATLVRGLRDCCCASACPSSCGGAGTGRACTSASASASHHAAGPAAP